MAQGAQRQILYIAESAWGTTPGTPSMKVLRNTGGAGIAQSRSQLLSEEMRSDRQIASMRLGTKKASLDVPIELSYGSYDDIFESVFFSTWSTDTLKTGVTLKSFSIEEGFTDIPSYLVARGMVADGFEISARPDAMVTGSVRFQGKVVDAPTGTPLDATPEAATTTEPFTTYEGSISIDGSPVATISGIDISIANGLDPKYPVFTQEAYRMGYGRSNVSGSLTAFFDNTTLLTNALNETTFSIEIVFTDVPGNELTLTLPKVKLGDESRSVSENDITENLPFQALYDSVSGTNIQLDRASA
jgi:hypothetical protein